MPKGKTASTMTRKVRLDHAFTYFKQGMTNAQVARNLKVHPDTITTYRHKYEEHLLLVKENNPGVLMDVLGNTLRSLEELDLVRADAWARLQEAEPHCCQECGLECGCYVTLNAQSAATLHNVVLKAMDQRTKLFGLLGVKQDVFLHIQQVSELQNKLLEFLQTQLCEIDRVRLQLFLGQMMPELSETSFDMDAEGEEVLA